jgi:uncharacterized membrane protein YhaH (DUF805 family)
MVEAAGAPQRGSFFSQALTFRGRSSRLNYWLTVILIPAMVAVANVIGYFANSQFDADRAFIVTAGLLIVSWLVAMVFYVLASIRRLHDRDKSGHWLWLFAFVPGMLNVLLLATVRPGVPPSPDAMTIAIAISLALTLVLSVWGFVEIGFLRGTSGSNRFGPDPLAGNRGG